jgi:hypothetical protein
MRFFEVIFFAAAALATVEFNSWPDSVKAGQTVTLTYSPKDVTTTILLKKGLSTDLKTLQTLTSTLHPPRQAKQQKLTSLQPLPPVVPSSGLFPPASRTAPTTLSRSSSPTTSPTTRASSP